MKSKLQINVPFFDQPVIAVFKNNPGQAKDTAWMVSGFPEIAGITWCELAPFGTINRSLLVRLSDIDKFAQTRAPSE